ncbi:hypothetical protein CVT24_012300 [Panaeolus cyanescens]|uniref:Aminoglycoside phosphotransferase domain-containing protein n=1 Tax=Panaeolus cyanescens TaxID=181874 RepID=A0A409W463_9AGAR|nr:hypothetical protein CVT24_012300 [Panaeolus cyanescens]
MQLITLSFFVASLVVASVVQSAPLTPNSNLVAHNLLNENIIAPRSPSPYTWSAQIAGAESQHVFLRAPPGPGSPPKRASTEPIKLPSSQNPASPASPQKGSIAQNPTAHPPTKSRTYKPKRKMPPQDPQQQVHPSQLFVPVAAALPPPTHLRNNRPPMGGQVSEGNFGKVYRHQSSSNTLIKVIPPMAGWTDEQRQHAVEGEVKGLILAGQYRNQWGTYIRKGQIYFYIFLLKVQGVTIDRWNPYIQVEHDEQRRVAVAHAVLQRVKDKAWSYFRHRRIIHGDPNPGNVLIRGTSVNSFEVDFIDWTHVESCYIDRPTLDAEIDNFWYEMFERHADSDTDMQQ